MLAGSSTAVRSTVRSLRSAQEQGLEQALWREGMTLSAGLADSP